MKKIIRTERILASTDDEKKSVYDSTMTNTYTDCREALSKSVSVCGRPNQTEEYKRCMETKMHISIDRSCNVSSGETPCTLSGDDVTFCARCTRSSSTAQTVHGVGGMYGGPSKLTAGEKSR